MEPERNVNVVISVSDINKTKQAFMLQRDGDFAHLEGQIPDNSLFYRTETGQNFAERFWQWQKTQYKPKPSPTFRYLAVISGDVMLLLLLMLADMMLAFSFPLIGQVAVFMSIIQNARIIWGCLGLISWVLAVNIAQQKKPDTYLSRIESPCYALLALLLMSIFWTIFSCLFLSRDLVSVFLLIVPFLVLAMPVFIIWRFSFAQIMILPRFRPLAVIVGVNLAGETLARELQHAPRSSARIIGYVGEAGEEKVYLNDLPILSHNELHALVHKRSVDMLIMAFDRNEHPALFKEVIAANQAGIPVLPITTVYENSTGKVPVEYVGDQWYAALPTGYTESPFYVCWKKALDLFSGICGLLLMCLVLPIVALLIFMDSPGPIFYRQERVGLHGKPFCMYKFRSMRTDAEIKGQAVWTQTGDQRVTRVGRFLRATHLDELPQIFNVLHGDMSLIGPRPERAPFVTELEKTVPFYRHRLVVKPGLTGWAQVKYHYGNTEDDALMKLQYDLYYIKNQSFTLDLVIVIRTALEVFALRGM